MRRSDDTQLLEDLTNEVVAMKQEITNLNRRIANMIKPGRVVSVDAQNYKHRVAYALDENGQDMTTTDIKWSNRAGKIRDWSPPTVDELVYIISPSGDINETSFTIPGHFTDKFPPNHDKEGEQKLTVDAGNSGGNSGNAKTTVILTKNDSQTVNSKTVTTNADQITDHAARIDHNEGGYT